MQQIRPLTTYKKLNPDFYELVAETYKEKTLSAKQQENEFYYSYCYLESGLYPFNKSFEEAKKTDEHKFFWKGPNTPNNKSIISELGRLLLVGWYYGEEVERFTKQICKDVFDAYQHRKLEGLKPRAGDFVSALKKIRENIVFCFQNDVEVRLSLYGYLVELT